MTEPDQEKTITTAEVVSTSLSLPDQATTWRFLDFIFEGATAGYIEFRYFSAGRKPRVIDHPAYHTLPLDHAEVHAELLSRNGQQMITVGVAPRCRIPPRGAAGKDSDVVEVGCIWANLDNKEAEGGGIEVMRRIRDFPLRPSITINSSYGHHVYFVFHAYLRGGMLLEWSEMIASLKDALQGDEKIGVSLVMRLTGTLNLKETHPLPCEISEEFSSWTRYSVEGVKHHMVCVK